MPIITKVEAKSVRGRLIFAAIFLTLTAGAVTILYPFAIMITGSMSTPMDQSDMTLVPRFLHDRDTLYRKFLETKYNQDLASLNSGHGRVNFSFAKAQVPQRVVDTRVSDLQAFFESQKLPRHWVVLGAIFGNRIHPANMRRLQDNLKARYAGDLDAFSRDAGATLTSWTNIRLFAPTWVSQRFDYPEGPIYEEYFRLADEAPPAELQIVSLSGQFLEQIVYPRYGQTNVQAFNDAHPGTPPISDYHEFALSRRVPPASQPVLREEWVEWVGRDLHPSFVTLTDAPVEEYRALARSRYDSVEQLNTAWSTDFASFDTITLPDGRQWLRGTRGRDYSEFFQSRPVETWELVGPEFAWRDFLRDKYGSLDALNRAHEASYASFDVPRVPIDELELQYVQENSGAVRLEHAFRNHVVVLRELITQGRPFWNTIIVCSLTVVLTLLINPMAAYAMSRFDLPGTYKVLLFLMATTAFPPMVVMVPKFLILRELDLLNGYIALVLPFVANGYSIFLLKGFFDSLPKNLYEAALIDGATELRMFFVITMALSKPILAVVALGAFTSAYTMFLYALIVCPKPEMWTLNVWLYQWQSNATMGGMFASLLIAALPTLLIFLFAQNIIMRGIVVPVEK